MIEEYFLSASLQRFQDKNLAHAKKYLSPVIAIRSRR